MALAVVCGTFVDKRYSDSYPCFKILSFSFHSVHMTGIVIMCKLHIVHMLRGKV